jgi:hypothetical protein
MNAKKNAAMESGEIPRTGSLVAAKDSRRELVLSVPCREDSPDSPHMFVLDAPTKGGFRIVARCLENKDGKPLKRRS